MDFYKICIIVSGFSFFAYSFYYLISTRMRDELSRLGMENLGRVIVISQFLGAAGIFLGLLFNVLLILSSFCLALLMFCGLLVRMRSKDSLWVSLPALFYLILNLYIFIISIQ
jgi:hypothetical protein